MPWDSKNAFLLCGDVVGSGERRLAADRDLEGPLQKLMPDKACIIHHKLDAQAIQTPSDCALHCTLNTVPHAVLWQASVHYACDSVLRKRTPERDRITSLGNHQYTKHYLRNHIPEQDRTTSLRKHWCTKHMGVSPKKYTPEQDRTTQTLESISTVSMWQLL